MAVKLAALVRDHAGEASVEPGVWPGGAALLRNGEAWVLAEERPDRAVGPSMAWARQRGAGAVHLLAESATGIMARRAGAFRQPPQVWYVEGRTLLPALTEPYPPAQRVPVELQSWRDLIVAGGADPVEEHGVLVGEVAGLEVCRAVVDEWTGVSRLEVGVGAHDREAFQLMHGDVPTVESLARVVAVVAAQRGPNAVGHPLSRLGAERLLRSRVMANPGVVGASSLRPVDPPTPRVNLKDPVPCVALGDQPDGSPVVVVFSVGVDLDVVPYAADARGALGLDGARLVIAVPRRDAHAMTTWMAGELVVPADVIGLEPPGGGGSPA